MYKSTYKSTDTSVDLSKSVSTDLDISTASIEVEASLSKKRSIVEVQEHLPLTLESIYNYRNNAEYTSNNISLPHTRQALAFNIFS
jgi:hypothetical protein